MLETFNQLAEQAATSISRRQLLDWLGRRALILAAGAAGTVALSKNSAAARPGSGVLCCLYSDGNRCAKVNGNCPKKLHVKDKFDGNYTVTLQGQVPCASCEDCLAGRCG